MRNTMLLLAAGLAAALLVLIAPAAAQEAAPAVPVASGGVIDLRPVLDQVLAAIAAALGAGLLYLLKLARDWFKARTGVQLQISDEQVREVLDKAIQYGIALVVGRLGERAQFAVSNTQIAAVANYVIAATPDALARFGITPDRLQDMIRARLVAWSDGATSAEPAAPVLPAIPAAPAVP